MKRTDLPIPSPCTQEWSTMTKEGQKRFCAACKKHVHDLSSMSLPQAQALLAAPSTEGLCVRYLYDAAGNIQFKPTDALVKPSALVRARKFVAGTAALAIPLSLNACMGTKMPEPHPTMGEPAIDPNAQVVPNANDADAGDASTDYPVMMGAPLPQPPQAAPQAPTPAVK